MSYTLQLDPSSAIAGRIVLDLNDPSSTGIAVGGTGGSQGVDWGTAEITEYATQQGKYGNTVADFVIPNRTVTIPLALGVGSSGSPDSNAALANLDSKVALFQREGGVLLRQRPGEDAMYADIVDAQLVVPDLWGESGIEPDVTLTLICLPDFYGDEIALDAVASTAYLSNSAVLKSGGTSAVIAGDYPARCRIDIANSGSVDMHGLLWSVQSRYESSASTAALVIPAANMMAINGAVVESAPGSGAAAGAINSEIVYYLTGGTSSSIPVLVTTLSGGPLTHTGTFRVWVRMIGGSNALQLTWGAGSLAAPVTNNQAAPPYAEWQLIDLGVVRIDPTNMEWSGVIQIIDQIAGNGTYFDEFYFQPLDEGAGQLISTSAPSPVGLAVDNTATTFANETYGGSGETPAWTSVSPYWQTVSALTHGTTTKSEYLQCTGLGFAVPSTATIVGVGVAVVHWGATVMGDSSRVNLSVYVRDNVVQLCQGAALIGTSRAQIGVQWKGTSTAEYAPSGTDLWGATLTPTIVNSSSFGVAIQAAATCVSAGTTQDTPWGQINQVRITVFYRLATGLTVAQDAVVYADQTCELATSGMTRENSGGDINGPVTTVLGDLPRIPPSGLEGRVVRLFVRCSEGDFASGADTYGSGLADFGITPYYRPCWMFRP